MVNFEDTYGILHLVAALEHQPLEPKEPNLSKGVLRFLFRQSLQQFELGPSGEQQGSTV
jgi:hypothetical protein